MDLIFSMAAGGVVLGAGVLLGAWLTHRREHSLPPIPDMSGADMSQFEEERPLSDEEEQRRERL